MLKCFSAKIPQSLATNSKGCIFGSYRDAGDIYISIYHLCIYTVDKDATQIIIFIYKTLLMFIEMVEIIFLHVFHFHTFDVVVMCYGGYLCLYIMSYVQSRPIVLFFKPSEITFQLKNY